MRLRQYIVQLISFGAVVWLASNVIPAFAQQPTVQFQNVVTVINNIQQQLATLTARINQTSQPAAPNQVLAGAASGSTVGTATFRSLVAADMPTLQGDTNGPYSQNTTTALHFNGTGITLGAPPSPTSPFVTLVNGQLTGGNPVGTVPTNPAGGGQLLYNNNGVTAWTGNGALATVLLGQGTLAPLFTPITGDVQMNSLGQTIVATLQGVTPGGSCTGTAPFANGNNATAVAQCMNAGATTPQFYTSGWKGDTVANITSNLMCDATHTTYSLQETWVLDDNHACSSGGSPVGGGSTVCRVICNGPGGNGWLEELVSGTGTVTSVAMTMDGTIFNNTVGGSPISGAGTLAPSLKFQPANTVLAGASSPGVTTPTFRALVSADLPAFGGSVQGPIGATKVNALNFGATTQTLSATAPTTGQCLQYNGTNIVGGVCGSGGGGGGGPDQTQTTNNGTTAGSYTCGEPWQTGAYKKVLCQLTGYENTTATPQNFTFTTAFTNTPVATANSLPLATFTVTALAMPSSMSAPWTGVIILEGF